MLILSGNISLNPGLAYNSESSCSNEWNLFKGTGSHLIHLNVNSPLPKINENRYIAARTNAAVMGYLNLSLKNPFFSRYSKYLTMRFSDVIGTEKVEVSLTILGVI